MPFHKSWRFLSSEYIIRKNCVERTQDGRGAAAPTLAAMGHLNLPEMSKKFK